jgi:hypothetical protein
MTISGTATSIVVNGDGLTSTFNYDFYMGGSSEYAVLVYVDEDGVSTTVDAADFTITGVTNQAGGTFTYPLVGSPIATGATLTLSRVLPIVQSAAIANQGNLYPSVIEQAFDYQTMVSQQLAEGAGQTIDALSLFGNATSTAGAGGSIALGSGFTFSGSTLAISGISGSGTVTQVNTGAGLTGGPITGVGTITMATITTGMVLGNFSGATAAPQGVTVAAGAGITLSTTTTSLTIASSGGMSFITSSAGNGTTGSITISGITQSGFSHLMAFVSGRSTAGSSPAVNVNMTFNGDGGSNYDQHGTQINNTTNGNLAAAAGTSIGVGLVPWSAAAASMAGHGEVTILNYTNTSLFKGGPFSRSTIGATSVDATWITGQGRCQWRSTASITSITFALSSGSFATGSIVSLYGLL